MQITVIAGTNRPGARSRRFAGEYLTRLHAAGYTAQLLDLALLPADFLGNNMYGQRSEQVAELEQQLVHSDVFVFVCPEYNGSFPGVLKLFLDAFPTRVFAGKMAAMVGVSTGKFGNLRGLDHLSAVLNYLQMDTFPYRAHIMQADRWPEDHLPPEAFVEIDRQLERWLPRLQMLQSMQERAIAKPI